MKSKRPEPDERIERPLAELPHLRLEVAILLGVNTRDIKHRWMWWIGGSSNRITPDGISMSARMSSRIDPRPER